MSNEKPEALELADIFENLAHQTGTRRRAATELRRQHARIQELEGMLEAVGAGGVSAQRVTQAKDHIEQDLKTVAAQEPFGWRDCADTDEGAIALYEAPQPQADARDAELVAAVVYASTEAMNSSMESPSFDGSIILESHHAARLSLALDELQQHRAAIAVAKENK